MRAARAADPEGDARRKVKRAKGGGRAASSPANCARRACRSRPRRLPAQTRVMRMLTRSGSPLYAVVLAKLLRVDVSGDEINRQFVHACVRGRVRGGTDHLELAGPAGEIAFAASNVPPCHERSADLIPGGCRKNRYRSAARAWSVATPVADAVETDDVRFIPRFASDEVCRVTLSAQQCESAAESSHERSLKSRLKAHVAPDVKKPAMRLA